MLEFDIAPACAKMCVCWTTDTLSGYSLTMQGSLYGLYFLNTQFQLLKKGNIVHLKCEK